MDDYYNSGTSMLKKTHDMKRENNQQLGQFFFESAHNKNCVDIEPYSITQGGVTYPGFQFDDINAVIEEVEIVEVMSLTDKEGNEISEKDKMARLLQGLRTELHFFEHKGRLTGSNGTDTQGNKFSDYSSLSYAFVHELFTTEKVEDIVRNNSEKNPSDWQKGKNLLQYGQVAAAEEVIHPMSERRIYSQKQNEYLDRGKLRLKTITEYYCRCGNCNKVARGGKEGFCIYHFNIHGSEKTKKKAAKKKAAATAKKKAAAKKKAVTKKK